VVPARYDGNGNDDGNGRDYDKAEDAPRDA
jgi:hypothetical protein